MAKNRVDTDKFFKDLHDAESESNHKQIVKLLKRAYKWKTLKNLQLVVEYLGYNDARCETLKGCKEIISENIEYHVLKVF
jgi:hypothetical protein